MLAALTAPERAFADVTRAGDDPPGIHIIVGDILTPYVLNVLGEKDPVKERLLFEFIERMAAATDEKIVNACTVSLLERLGDDLTTLTTARRLMSPSTKALSIQIEQFLGPRTKLAIPAFA